MNEIHLFLLSFLALWLLVYIVNRALQLKKYGLNIKPFFIKWESERFRKLLYKFSRMGVKRLRFLSYIGVIMGFGLMVFILALLSWNLIKRFILYEPAQSVTILVPGLTLKLYWLPYFLVAVVVTILVHEAAHGIVALSEGVNVKSAGLLLLAIFFGGFVELNEEELERASRNTKIKIFSAGSATNLLIGLLVFLLLLGLFAQSPSGLIVPEVLEGGPLHKAGVRAWDIIYALNGTRIGTYQDLAAFMSKVKPGDNVLVETSRGSFIVTAAPSPEDPQRPIIGVISPLPYYQSRVGLGRFLDIQLYFTLNWMFLVLFSVAAFNMLPIPFFDGDRMLQCLLEKLPRTGSILKKFFNLVSIFLMIANVVVSGV